MRMVETEVLWITSGRRLESPWLKEVFQRGRRETRHRLTMVDLPREQIHHLRPEGISGRHRFRRKRFR